MINKVINFLSFLIIKKYMKIIFLSKNFDFQEVFKKGKRKKKNNFLIFFKKNNFNYTRFGISLTKKIKTKVLRNKIKRQIKEMLRKVEYNKCYDIVIFVFL